jgi:plastocyanin
MFLKIHKPSLEVLRMRHVRLAAVFIAAALLLVLGITTVATASPSQSVTGGGPSTTYNVWVGAENAHRGVDIMAFFPDSIRIHVGDTVQWLQNSNEIHTVTFLGDQPQPEFVVPAVSLGLPATPSPLVVNPLASDRTPSPVSLSDQTTWANSGVMGREQGQYGSFTVTFTAEGTYEYLCLVHGTMMSGTVQVVPDATPVPTPMKVKAIARSQIARQFSKVPAVFRAAVAAEVPATMNQDGTWTHHVLLGFGRGQIDLMRFFPTKVNVRPGDTVQWMMTADSDAPHTVTFLNGTPEPPFIVPVPQQGGGVVLYLGPGVFYPSMPAGTLTRTGFYNSGFLLPIPGTVYSLTVGDITPGPLRYLCQLHDTSGMRGRLVVLP